METADHYNNITNDANNRADFVRFGLGCNVIPALYSRKVPLVEWKIWQTEPIPIELHEQWKKQNLFRDGMGIILGYVFHIQNMAGHYLACLDTDNELATKILRFNPNTTLVQQRQNAKDRAHTFFYSTRPVKRKPGSSSKDLKERYDKNLAPKFELRCVGDIVYAGKHASGFYYENVGIDKPALLTLESTTQLEGKIKSICAQYGLANSTDQPASELFKEDFKVYEGDNRSLYLKRVMLRLLRNFHGDHSLEEIKVMAQDWHNKHCVPPYDEESGIFERNWKQATDIVLNDKPIGDFLNETPKTTQSEETPAERIMRESTFKTCTDNFELYYFNGKVYVPNQEWRIREQCRTIVEGIQNKHITEIISYIKDTTYIDRSEFDSNPDLVVVDNGILNIHTRELKPFTPEHLSIVGLPIPYNKEADCPKIKAFLSEVMASEKDVNDIVKLIGYCLIPTCEYEIDAMLYGPGRNGKGTLLRVIEAFLGKKHCSNRSLQDLDNNRFAVADLFGKMANILADLKALKMRETGYFKMITSGDTLTGEKKFQHSFSFVNRAKQFYSANELPETEDKTDAFFRRWRLFPTFKEFDIGNGRNTQLIKELTTAEELSGLLNWVLDGLQQLIKDGGIPQDIDKIRDEWERHTNDVSAFLYEKCTVDVRNKEYFTKTADLYNEYIKFCEGRNSRPKDFNAFGRKLSEQDIVNRKHTIYGETAHYYDGVILGLPEESWDGKPQ